MLDISLDARSGTPVVPHTEVGGAGTGLRCECPGGAVASACALLASGVHACASIFVRASLSASAGTLRDLSRMAGGGGCRFMLFIRQSCSSSSWVETLLVGSSETCVAAVASLPGLHRDEFARKLSFDFFLVRRYGSTDVSRQLNQRKEKESS